jgi:peptide/nickel transport system ATP-binding protein
MSDVLIETHGLKKYFKTPRGLLHAVDNVNIRINRGKTLGVVGESGCGKSTLGRVLLRLLDSTDGEILFDGKDVVKFNKHEMVEYRKQAQMIFQDPYSSINPRMTVSQTIAEPMEHFHTFAKKEDREDRVYELMETVGLAERFVNAFPHELDGGRRQRIGVARALALNPKFIVCDEPVSALDVSIQAQVINMFEELQEKLGLAYLFIAHDLLVVHHISDRIAVMYLGHMMEIADADELNDNPMHP